MKFDKHYFLVLWQFPWQFQEKVLCRVSASPECLRGGGGGWGVRGGVFWGSSSRRKKSDFKILVLKMVYFYWNDSKIWNIFLFSSPTRGDIPPLVLSKGVRTPPFLAETLLWILAKGACKISWKLIKNWLRNQRKTPNAATIVSPQLGLFPLLDVLCKVSHKEKPWQISQK